VGCWHEIAQAEHIPVSTSQLISGEGATMLSLTVHILGDVTVFRCVGRITFAYTDTLRIAVIKQTRLRVVVLDLGQVSAIDAAGLGMLVSLRKWSSSNGLTLKLMNLTPHVEDLLELTNLRSMFEICSARDMLELLCQALHKFENAGAGPAMEDHDEIPENSRPIRASVEAML
jgi:anti-anti-sigma factor